MSLFYNHSNFSKIEEQNISAIFFLLFYLCKACTYIQSSKEKEVQQKTNREDRESSLLPLFGKKIGKMPLFANHRGACPYFDSRLP